MRKALLTFVISIWILGLKSQSIQLFSESGLDVTNQSMSIVDGEELKIHVKNVSNQDMVVAINFREAVLPEGSENSICWQYCYDNTRPGTDFGTINIDAGVTNTTAFHCTYFSNDITEQANFVFVFYNQSNVSDSAQVILNYNPNSIKATQTGNFSIYPNPACDFLNFDFQVGIDAIKFLDLTGRVVFEENFVSQNQITLNLSSLSDGVYGVEIIGKQIIYRQKVVIRKM